ncbi:MAG: hypothetical protein EOO69_13580 [Moraxellaceae bacterium]|nr:MAG: hypothetical protein EOO69_13580 [Moraxellaceae bacterium]
MTFRENLAGYVIGDLLSDQLPGIAVSALEEGLDSPSLRILAGLPESTNPFQIKSYLKLAMTELEIGEPDLRTAALIYSAGLARQIVDGQLPVLKGVAKIRWHALDKYDFFAESRVYVYDSIRFSSIYGLYVSLDELPQVYDQLQTEKTLEEEQAWLETQIRSELKAWRPLGPDGA